MTRRPLLLLAAILLALLVVAALLWCWVGLLRELSQVSAPIGQGAANSDNARSQTTANVTPTVASRGFARSVLPASPDPAADQPAARAASPTDGNPTPLIGKAGPSGLVTTQGPVVVGKAATGPSAYEKLRAAISWCESRNQPTVVNKTSGAAGLFQFMPRTWEAVTGLKPPASAYSVAVQTAAFDALYKLHGTQPWDSSKGCWSK